ncbi:MAG: DUF805 domain-containing protein [Capnocytophaga sp.]|nr:DUF805 domain-containing protein [Capnocytophaga sp.]
MEQFNLYFVDVLKNKYATFSGRARRKEYWMFMLFSYIIFFLLLILGSILGSIASFLGGIFSILVVILSLALVVPGIALGVRRMQDLGKDWWYILIPYYNIYLCCLEGEKGANKYGPDPKA